MVKGALRRAMAKTAEAKEAGTSELGSCALMPAMGALGRPSMVTSPQSPATFVGHPSSTRRPVTKRVPTEMPEEEAIRPIKVGHPEMNPPRHFINHYSIKVLIPI